MTSSPPALPSSWADALSALSGSPAKSSLLLLCLSAAIYLPALGASGIHRAQEARVAEVAREMQSSGEWVVPHLNGRVRLNKPPLPYWAVLGSYTAFGAVTERTARIPTALAAIAGILLTAALARRLYGPGAALLAGAVLATTQLYIVQGRRAESDVPMTLFVILSLYALERGFREGRRAWKPLFFGAMGLAFMTKGVPGIAVPLLAALIWLFLESRIREVLRPSFLSGLGLVLLIIAPWYLIIWYGFPEAIEVFRTETVARLGQNAPHANPFYYYFLRSPLHLLPWILLLPVAWAGLRSDREAREASRLPLAWFVGGLCFLTLLQGKQPHYLVPLVPPFAILMGGGLDRVIASARPAWVTRRFLALFTAVTALAAILFVTLIEPRVFARKSPREACTQVAERVASEPLILYRFNSSACVFYLRRTAPVAEDAAHLVEMLKAAPGAYILSRENLANTAALQGRTILWRSERYKRSLVLLGPRG